MKKVSIIIPTCNKPAYLNRTLASLVNQLQSRSYEVIVVDDYNKDNSAKDICKFWRQKITINYVKVKKYRVRNGRAIARNLGVQKAEGDLLIFIDDDMIVPPYFIEEHVRSHQGKDCSVVIGYRYYLRPTYRFIEYINPVNLLGDFNVVQSLPQVRDEREDVYRICKNDINCLNAPWVVLYSNNFSVPRELMLSVGGFQEKFHHGWGGEDVELGFRLFKAKAVFILNRRAIGYHQWHYNNLQKNIRSLQNNLKIFYHLHPTWEIELYIDYVDIGLKNYLLDLTKLKQYKSQELKNGQIKGKEPIALNNSSENTLLIGWDKKLFADTHPSACCEIREKVLTKIKKNSYLTNANFYPNIGIHTIFKDKEFNHCIINGHVWKVLKHYHIKMMIEESLRIAKNILIYLPKSLLRKIISGNTKFRIDDKFLSILYSYLGFSYHHNLRIETKDCGRFLSISAKKSKTQKSLLYSLNNKPRIAFVFSPNEKENFNNNIIELALELKSRGCDICFEFEDARTESIVPNTKFRSLRKYFSPEEWNCLRGIFNRNIEGIRKFYPRLSTTGRLHYCGEAITWFHLNYVGILPSYQIYTLNHTFSLIWCTSNEIRKCYLRSGGDPDKISFVPIGVNCKLADEVFKNRKKAEKNTFTFLAVGTIAKRDGIDAVVQAFCDEFRKDGRVNLLIKLLPPKVLDFEKKGRIYNSTVKMSSRKYSERASAIHNYQIHTWRNIARKSGISAKRFSIVYIEEGIRNWINYFTEGDCYVQAHRSDLIGDRIMQAMASGMPVIATDKYLVEGLCVPQNSYSVRSRDVSAVMDEWTNESIYSKWAEPDISYLRLAMRHIEQNRKEAIKKSYAAREHILKKWNWGIVADKVIYSLHGLQSPRFKKTNPDDSANELNKLLLRLSQSNLLSIEEESIERK